MDEYHQYDLETSFNNAMSYFSIIDKKCKLIAERFEEVLTDESGNPLKTEEIMKIITKRGIIFKDYPAELIVDCVYYHLNKNNRNRKYDWAFDAVVRSLDD